MRRRSAGANKIVEFRSVPQPVCGDSKTFKASKSPVVQRQLCKKGQGNSRGHGMGAEHVCGVMNGSVSVLYGVLCMWSLFLYSMYCTSCLDCKLNSKAELYCM